MLSEHLCPNDEHVGATISIHSGSTFAAAHVLEAQPDVGTSAMLLKPAGTAAVWTHLRDNSNATDVFLGLPSVPLELQG